MNAIMHSRRLGETMKKSERPKYAREFKLEAAQLVVDQDYTISEADEAMGVSISSMNNWIKKLPLIFEPLLSIILTKNLSTTWWTNPNSPVQC